MYKWIKKKELGRNFQIIPEVKIGESYLGQ